MTFTKRRAPSASRFEAAQRKPRGKGAPGRARAARA